MAEVEIKGHEAGVRLWNLMASSTDAEEQAYYKRLASAASQFGRVWFTDSVTQRETKKNQTIWSMEWHAQNAVWIVDKFLVPDKATEISPRLQEEEVIEIDDEEWEDINPDDIIAI